MRNVAGHNIVDVTIPKGKIKAFWKKVKKHTPTDCWQWKGAEATNGYARFRINNAKTVQSARIAWVLENRAALPSWHRLKRTCPNRMCVNPLHVKRIENDLAHPDVGKRKHRPWVLHPPGNLQIIALSDALHPDNDASSWLMQETGAKILDRLQAVEDRSGDIARSIMQLISAQKSRVRDIEMQVSGLSEAGTRVLNIEHAIDTFLAAQEVKDKATAREAELFRTLVNERFDKYDKLIHELVVQNQSIIAQNQRMLDMVSSNSASAPVPEQVESIQDKSEEAETQSGEVENTRSPFTQRLAEVFTQTTSFSFETEEDWEALEAAFDLLQAREGDAVDAYFVEVERYKGLAQAGQASIQGFLEMVQEPLKVRSDISDHHPAHPPE